jgi:DNA invertase Pin-like site-specific DNA recombinase
VLGLTQDDRSRSVQCVDNPSKKSQQIEDLFKDLDCICTDLRRLSRVKDDRDRIIRKLSELGLSIRTIAARTNLGHAQIHNIIRDQP